MMTMRQHHVHGGTPSQQAMLEDAYAVVCDCLAGEPQAIQYARETKSLADDGHEDAKWMLRAMRYFYWHSKVTEQGAGALFPSGPGKARVGGYGMPEHHRPGIILGGSFGGDMRGQREIIGGSPYHDVVGQGFQDIVGCVGGGYQNIIGYSSSSFGAVPRSEWDELLGMLKAALLSDSGDSFASAAPGGGGGLDNMGTTNPLKESKRREMQLAIMRSASTTQAAAVMQQNAAARALGL